MKQKTKFIICGIVVPALFIIGLVIAIIFSIQNKDNEVAHETTIKSIETVSAEITSNDKTDIETINVEYTTEADTTDYEVEQLFSSVPIKNMTDKEMNYLGNDMYLLEEKINELIIGHGYQNADEIRFEESEFSEDEKTFVMTFVLKTHLNKDPYIVVKYQKEIHTFDLQIW